MPPSLSLSHTHTHTPSPPLSLLLGNWEKFEESHQVSKKFLSSTVGGVVRKEGGGGAVCAADAMVSDSQWTALDDSRHRELFGE